MSIVTVRKALEGIIDTPIYMRYEQGGKAQAFEGGGVTVRVGPMASNEEIKAAFVAELAKS